MTPTTKTRISNRKQIWRHNSWWNLRGKLPMEWVICLQNLWVAQKKEQKDKQQSNLIKIYPFKAYRLGRIIFYTMSSLYAIIPERCEHIRNACRGTLPFLTLSSIVFLFFKLGSAIVVHHCRLPYPRLKVFSFPSYHFRLPIFIYSFKDDLNKAFQDYFV